MNHKKAVLASLGALAALAVPTAAVAASGETANISIPKSATALNPKTCRFLHREIDPATGPSWKNLRTYVLYEDARHDVKMSCLAHHMGGSGKRGPRGVRGPAGPAGPAGSGALAGYTQVRASGTGASVTATCPSGDVVLGGGSPDETTGSYPSSNNAWTIRRDHLSPPRMTVIATCAKAAS